VGGFAAPSGSAVTRAEMNRGRSPAVHARVARAVPRQGEEPPQDAAHAVARDLARDPRPAHLELAAARGRLVRDEQSGLCRTGADALRWCTPRHALRIQRARFPTTDTEPDDGHRARRRTPSPTTDTEPDDGHRAGDRHRDGHRARRRTPSRRPTPRPTPSRRVPVGPADVGLPRKRGCQPASLQPLELISVLRKWPGALARGGPEIIVQRSLWRSPHASSRVPRGRRCHQP
jgi:hypothetical protein